MTDLPQELTNFLSHFPGRHLFAKFGDLPIATHDLEWIFTQANNEHCVFFTVNESDGSGKRKESNIVKCRSLFLDDDKGGDTHRTIWPIKPSLIVQTSPKKYHYYWLIEGGTTSFEEWKQVEAALVHVHEGDPAVKDLPRVLRLPCTVNRKNKFKVKVLDNSGTLYPWSKLVDSFPPLPDLALEKPPGNGKSDFNNRKSLELLYTGESGFHPALRSIAWYLQKSGHSPSQSKLILHYLTQHQRDNPTRPEVTGYLRDLDRMVDTAAGKGEWDLPTPIPLPSFTRLPFPLTIFPPWVREGLTELAEFMQVSVELPAAALFGFVRAGLSRTCEVEELEGHNIRMSGIIIIVASSGERKSPTFGFFTKPIVAAEKIAVKHFKQKLARLTVEKKALEKALTSKLNEDKKEKPNERKLDAMQALQVRINEIEEESAKPRYLCLDITEEEYKTQLCNQNGNALIASGEGGFFVNNLLNEYGDNPKESAYLQSTGNDEIMRINRRGREEDIEKPCGNIVIALQPAKFIQLDSNAQIKDVGLKARTFTVFPKEMMGYRQHIGRKRKRDNDKTKPLQDFIEKLYTLNVETTIKLGDDCTYEHEHFSQEMEDNLRRGGKMRPYKNIVNKAPTQSVCNAAVLEALWHLDKWYKTDNLKDTQSKTVLITEEMYKRGIELTRYDMKNKIYSEDKVHEDAITEKAINMMSTLQRTRSKTVTDLLNATSFPKSKLKSSVNATYRDSDTLDRIITVMIEHGFLRAHSFTELQFHPQFRTLTLCEERKI